MAIKEKRNGVWTGRWIARVKKNGKQKQLGKPTFDQDEAVLREIQWRSRNVRVGRAGTWREFGIRWPEDFPRPKESTNLHNEERISQFLEDHGDMLVDDFDGLLAVSMIWAKDNPARVPAVRAMVTDAYSELRRNGIPTPANPFFGLRPIRQRDIVARKRQRIEAKKAISANDLEKLLQVADDFCEERGPLLRAMIALPAWIGTRPGETMYLGVEDLKGDLIHVQEQWNRKTRKPDTPKNHLDRFTPFSSRAKQELARVELSIERPMLRAPSGTPWTPSGWNYYWTKIRERAGLPDFKYKNLRNFFITWLLDQGHTPEQIEPAVGHQDGGGLIRTTYGDPNQDLALKSLLKTLNSDDDGVAEREKRPNLRVA